MSRLDLGIGQRLWAAFLAVCLLVAATGAVAVDAWRVMAREEGRVDARLQRARFAQDLERAVLRLATSMRAYALAGTGASRAATETALREEEAAYRALDAVPKEPDGRAAWSATPPRRELYREAAEAFLAGIESSGDPAALRAAEQDLTQLRTAYLAEVEAYLLLQSEKLQRSVDDLRATRDRLQHRLALATALLLVAVALTAAATTRSVRAGAARLAAAARAVEAGAFEAARGLDPADGAAPPPAARDELRRVGFALARMAREIEAREQRLREANDELAAQNEELQAQAEELQAQNEEIQAQNEEIQAQNEEIQVQSEEIQAQSDEIQERSASVAAHAARVDALALELQERNAVLAARNRDLADAARERERFLAVLSHELRNPLSAMQNASAVLSAAPPGSPAARQSLEILERQVRHQARLVDDLLDVARLALGKIALRRERVDLARVAAEVAAEHHAAFAEKNVRLVLQLPDAPAFVVGDPVRLAQAAGNVLANALKFTPPGGTVTVRVDDGGADDAVRFAVTDTGDGIPQEQLPHIFRALFQAGPAVLRGGLGLGLSIVKGVVEQLGGGVAAESDGEHKGSRVSFWLPRAPAAQPSPPRPATRDGSDRRALSVLVVEDHVDGATALATLLEAWGHRVRLAHSGPDGLSAARASAPDLVLCDLGLPGLDGCGVAAAMRGDPALAEVPLVALTGYGSDDDRRRCAEAGFDRVLVKPADPDELEAVLRACTRRPAGEAR